MTVDSQRLRAGQVFAGKNISTRTADMLLQSGRITRAYAPPLSRLRGGDWEQRAALVGEMYNIATIAEFVGLDNLPAPFAAWQEEALRALDAPHSGCKHCGGKRNAKNN